MAKDLYQTLGVKRDASQKEIREAYRRLARQYHPDVNPGNTEAERRFKEINASHEVLSEPEKRQKYDRYGDQWEHAEEIERMRREGGGFGQRGGPGGGFGGPSGPSSGGGGAHFEFGDLGGGRGGVGGIFDNLFGRAAGRRRGTDVEHTVQVSLDEAYHGAKRTVEVRGGEETCRICGGAGTLAGATCHACRGSGNAAPLRRIEVAIPQGVASGTRIRVAGKGGPGGAGAPPGDLFLRVNVRPHPRFERDGDDLRVTVDVPVVDAVLGGEARVPTLKGKALALTVPAGTQGGRVFRLAGQGMPRRQGSGFGDLHAQVRIVVPDPPTEEQRALFERLRDSINGAGRDSVDADANVGATDEAESS